MNTKALNDEAMESIVGGSSYIAQLQSFIRISGKSMPTFNVIYHKEGTPDTQMTHLNCPVTEMGMKSLIKIANESGKVTMIAANGKRTDFTADGLKAMM